MQHLSILALELAPLQLPPRRTVAVLLGFVLYAGVTISDANAQDAKRRMSTSSNSSTSSRMTGRQVARLPGDPRQRPGKVHGVLAGPRTDFQDTHLSLAEHRPQHAEQRFLIAIGSGGKREHRLVPECLYRDTHHCLYRDTHHYGPEKDTQRNCLYWDTHQLASKRTLIAALSLKGHSTLPQHCWDTTGTLIGQPQKGHSQSGRHRPQ